MEQGQEHELWVFKKIRKRELASCLPNHGEDWGIQSC